MRDANVLSCISRLLLHFHPRIHDSNEREVVDEAVEFALGVFADIQARLQFPIDIVAKVVHSVKTQRHLVTAGTDAIHDIPAALTKLTSLMSRIQEKCAEEAIRAIGKEGRQQDSKGF